MKSLVLMAIAAAVLVVAATWAIADVNPGSAATPSGTTSVAFDDDSSSSDDDRNRGAFGNRRSSRNRDILDVILGRDVRINGSDGDSDDDSSGDGWNDSQRVRRNDRGSVILRDGSVVIDRDGRVILRPRRN